MTKKEIKEQIKLLKVELKQKKSKEKLKAQTWYKSKVDTNYIVYVKAFDKESVEVYGWDNNKNWFEDEVEYNLFWNKERPLVNLSVEDVEAALIEEAKKMGFKEGIKVKCLTINNPIDLIEHFHFEFDLENNELWLYQTNVKTKIFSKGKWAEIVEEPKDKINWNKHGQLLSDGDGYIVFTSGLHNTLQFEASVIQAPLSVGTYHTLLNKSEFKLYKGSITLKND